MTTKAMLIFSLGSVQSFISQARKTRDLWLGSYLFSALMEAAMEGMTVIDPAKKDSDQEGIVFPAQTTLLRRTGDSDYVGPESFKKNIPELPNKYVAIYKDAETAQQVARASAEKVEARWKVICADVWAEVIVASGIPNLKHVEQIWKRQVEDIRSIFETFWVVVEGDPENYGPWLEKTEQTLGARKLIRNFVPQDERGEKSTISGEREALSRSENGNPAHSRQEVRNFWKELSAHLVEIKKANKRLASPLDISTDGSERLDAIDTIKRFAMQAHKHAAHAGKNIIPEQPFPTVSSIATTTFVRALLDQLNGKQTDPRLVQALENWGRATGDPLITVSEKAIPALYMLAREKAPVGNIKPVEILERDGDCFMPETFRFQRLQKDYGIKGTTQAKNLAEQGGKALKALLDITDEIGLRRPRPYYAILQMDGDGLGNIMRGVKNSQEHQRISDTMANFARNQVPLIVEKDFLGRLVYAGGDDVLAFASLKDLLTFADKLQRSYHKIMFDELKTHTTPPGEVTASMGIAIAHTYAPLSYVLRSSREAERSAKGHYGRDSLVITILRRSGQQTRVGTKWSYPGLAEEARPIPLFNHFSMLFEQDILSPKCIHLLLEESPTLVHLEPAAQISEIKRIFKRQSSNTPAHKPYVEKLDQDAQHLVALAQEMEKANLQGLHTRQKVDNDAPKALALDLHSEDHRHGLVEALGWLLVMEFLDRKRELN